MKEIKSQHTPLVAIHTLVYNHEHFLHNYFAGIVAQKTNFPFVAIVHEDCSIDNSASIIKEYAEKYPDIIKPIYEDHNVYRNEGSINIFYKMKEMSDGAKYIAICEGDDYWTDPLKLQKQVDFLESHSDYSVCWHRCKRWIVKTDTYIDDYCGALFKEGKSGMDIDMATYFLNWYTQPLTMVYRKECLDLDWCSRFTYFRDLHLMYNLLTHGKGYLFAFEGGVYTIHAGGVAGAISKKQYCDVSLPIDREFYWKTLDPFAKKQYIDTLETCVKEYASKRPMKALRYAFRILFLTGHPRSVIRNLKTIFGKK